MLRPEPGQTAACISELIEAQQVSPDLPRFRRLADELRHAETRTLIARLETTSAPLLLWAAHLELDARDVPPGLRWPGNQDDEQALFITLSADLFWFCKRNPTHVARFAGWRSLFKHQPGSAKWHAAAHRQFLFVQPRYSLSHWCSKGLGLADDQRVMLMTLPTNQMRADRRALDGDALAEIERLVRDDALAKPDKAGRWPADEIARRRAAMWRTFVLCGRKATVAATHWSAITGERITRQAFSKHVNAVNHLLRLRARGVIA